MKLHIKLIKYHGKLGLDCIVMDHSVIVNKTQSFFNFSLTNSKDKRFEAKILIICMILANPIQIACIGIFISII